MPKRVDDNQKEIVTELREIGATVQHLHTIGKGCPDILVGFGGRNYLFEIKDPSKPPSQTKLTPAELKWSLDWTGQYNIIYNITDATEVFHAIR